MKCVTDTGPPSWLARIDYLDLLPKIYERIYAPPAVFRELEPHIATWEFMNTHVVPINFGSQRDRKRFEYLVNRWKKKVGLNDTADIEVFIGYKFFTDADEALYANNEAEEKLSHYGSVRDIYKLYELAEERGIFKTEDSINYLESLLNLDPPYRPKIIRESIEKLKKRLA